MTLISLEIEHVFAKNIFLLESAFRLLLREHREENDQIEYAQTGELLLIGLGKFLRLESEAPLKHGVAIYNVEEQA